MLAAQAKERQKRKPCDFVPQNSAEQKGETREDIAKIAGVSRDTISKVSVIQEKGSPEQIQRARTGGKGNTVNAIYHEITTVDSIINSLYDTNTPVELTSDDLAEDILCVVSNFAGDIDRCIEEYDVTITEENGKKIKAALEKTVSIPLRH